MPTHTPTQRRTGHACIWAMPGGPVGWKIIWKLPGPVFKPSPLLHIHIPTPTHKVTNTPTAVVYTKPISIIFSDIIINLHLIHQNRKAIRSTLSWNGKYQYHDDHHRHRHHYYRNIIGLYERAYK